MSDSELIGLKPVANPVLDTDEKVRVLEAEQNAAFDAWFVKWQDVRERTLPEMVGAQAGWFAAQADLAALRARLASLTSPETAAAIADALGPFFDSDYQNPDWRVTLLDKIEAVLRERSGAA